MRIIFVNQYYRPDVAATAQQLADLAEHLADAGHEVHVLCSQGLYDAALGSTRPPRRERLAGVEVHRLHPWGSRRAGLAGRLLAYLGFDLGCLGWVLFRVWRYDVIVTLTEPPLIGLLGVLIRKLSFRRIRHVVWSMDLYTDCMFALGSVRPNRPLGWLLEWLNRLELRSADATVVLGECMRERAIGKGVPSDRLEVIGVWNRADQLKPLPTLGHPLRAEHGLDGAFVAMYSGNAGRSHDFDSICAAMLALDRECNDIANIQFLFVGGGKRLSEIQAFACEHDLNNFRCLPYFPREQLSESLTMGDVHLVSLHPQMAGVVVPCKLYGIMAVARPVIFIGPAQSTVAREIDAAGAGVTLTGEQTKELIETLQRLAADPQRCREMGTRGRQFFLEQHERDVCCRRWQRLLERLTSPTVVNVPAAADAPPDPTDRPDDYAPK